MATNTVVRMSAAIEVVAGVALIATPEQVVRVVLGAELSSSGVAVARLAGCGLLSLGLACWPGKGDVTPQGTRALFVYNLLAGLYLGYLRVGGGFVSYLLWPVCAAHTLLALLLARAAYVGVLAAKAVRPNTQ